MCGVICIRKYMLRRMFIYDDDMQDSCRFAHAEP